MGDTEQMPFVEIEKRVYGRMKHMAAVMGMSPEKAIRSALIDWLEMTGDPLLDFLGDSAKGNRPSSTFGPATSLLDTDKPELIRVNEPKYLPHHDPEV